MSTVTPKVRLTALPISVARFPPQGRCLPRGRRSGQQASVALACRSAAVETLWWKHFAYKSNTFELLPEEMNFAADGTEA